MDSIQHPAATHVVSVLNTNLPVIEYRGERVVTLAIIDLVHARPEGTAGRNFRRHRDRLIEGEDYYKVCADEIRRHKLLDISSKTHEDVILLAVSGYLLLAKSSQTT
jgi:hypothetical protein